MRRKTKMPQKKFKKYCLLENGQIKLCHYGNGELRRFDKEGGKWYLTHDEYGNNIIFTMRHKVIKFADTFEELQKTKKPINKGD